MISQLVFQSGEIINQSPEKGFWDYFFPLLTPSIALAAFIVAYRTYKNYDVKKSILKYQLDAVFELLKVLQETKWLLNVKEYGKTVFTTLVVVEKIESLIEGMYGNLPTKGEIYFSPSSLHEMQLFNFINNRFIPRGIADQIEKLQAGTVVFTHPNELAKVERAIFISEGKYKDEKAFAKEPDIYVNHITNFHSFEDYFRQVLILQYMIDQWLNKFHVDDLNSKLRKI